MAAPIPALSLSPLRKRASILIVCLWVFAFLSILSLAVANFVFQQIKFANFFIRASASLPLAKSSLQRVFYERKHDDTPDYDSFEELSQERMQLLCENTGYKYYFLDKKLNGEEEAEVIDESALININLASRDVLMRLPGIDEDLAQKIIESGRRPFKLKEELLLTEGMDKDNFEKIKDMITVYGNGKININTVSKEVLLALGLDNELAELILRFRRDEGAFTNVANILSDLRDFKSLSLRQEQKLLSLMSMLSVKSSILRLNVIPQIKAKEGIRYSIVISPEEKRIISWSEFSSIT